MDHTRFDRWTQAIATGAPRRALLASLAGGIVLASRRQPVAADHQADHEDQGQGPKCKDPCSQELQGQIDALDQRLDDLPNTEALERQVTQLQTQVTQLQNQLQTTRFQLEQQIQQQISFVRSNTFQNLSRLESCVESRGGIFCPGDPIF